MTDVDVIGVDDKSLDGTGHAADTRRPLSLGSEWPTAMRIWTSAARIGMGSGSYWLRVMTGHSHARQRSTAEHRILQRSGHSQSGLGLRISMMAPDTPSWPEAYVARRTAAQEPSDTLEIADQGDDGDLCVPARFSFWRPVSRRIRQR